MEKDLYKRRSELYEERDALVVALRGLRNYFVAVLAEELPTRWDWAERCWFLAHPDVAEPHTHNGLNPALDNLKRRAREVANETLSGFEVWGHEGSEDQIWRMRPYEPVGSNSKWSHVSDAITATERKVFSVLEAHVGQQNGELAEWEGGVVSDALREILEMYSQAFGRLQKVDKATSKVNSQITKAKEERSLARRWG